MVIINPRPEHKFFMDGYLKANLDACIKDVRKKDHDKFILLVGKEGVGKTTLSFQCALYVDPTFDLDRVVFTPQQFLEAVEHAEKYQAIVFDETVWSLGARSAMTKMNRVLVKVMSEMRSKNLFVFMNIPNFFMMDWYVAQHRTTGLLYIYQRGRFGSYDYPTKKKLYLLGKRMHNYGVSPNFIGNYPKHFCVDKEKYEAKKQLAINSWIGKKQTSDAWKDQRNLLINYIAEHKLMSAKEIGEVISLTMRQIHSIIEKKS